VGLVRRGLTNRQIADELVIAEKTAINHMAHVLDKLGVHSRTELVARASELRLDQLPT
jgi:DNA-binding NarL/FixJ family response regulator